MKTTTLSALLFVPLLFLTFFYTTIITHAQSAQSAQPAVTSLTADPMSLGNGHAILVTWNSTASTGAAISVTCPTGVSVQNSDGSPLLCGVPVNVSSVSGTGSATYSLFNVSGVTASVTITVYPLDSSGAPYLGNPASVTVMVTTSPHPIQDFSVASSTLMSGGTQTLTWTGIDIKNTNIEFDCVTGIQVIAQGATVPLPCNAYVFTPDLPASGSQVFTVNNTTLFPLSITAHVIPKSDVSTYDATHSLSATFSVSGIVVAPDPATSAFSSNAQSVQSNASTTFYWSTTNASNANLQFGCVNGITVTALGTTSIPYTLPCNTPGLTTLLDPTGTTTVTIVNSGYGTLSLPVTLLPANAAGVYYATNGKVLNLQVLPPGAQPVATVATPITTTTSTTTTTPTSGVSIPKYVFTKSLKRGSSNADVTALQTLLALNSALYPEGTVTGYFGVATERALGRFQIKYGIAKVGEAGYQTVGPKTRAVLNSLHSI